MTVKITYFVHGTTTDNERHIATGWLPGTLSRLGQEQVKKLGELVKDHHFDSIFCSDLLRAVDSAKLAFPSKTILQDERLREINYGDYNGKPNTFKNRIRSFVDKNYPHGESYKDVEKRMMSFLDFLKKKHNGKDVAIMSHHAPQLALDVLLRGKTWKAAILEDWRRKKAWQPGWEYVLK